MFCLWKENVCSRKEHFSFERQMCVLKDKCAFSKTKVLETQISKGKYCKNSSQNTDFTTQKANSKKGNVPFVMCLVSSLLRYICLKREMCLLKEKCVF